MRFWFKNLVLVLLNGRAKLDIRMVSWWFRCLGMTASILAARPVAVSPRELLMASPARGMARARWLLSLSWEVCGGGLDGVVPTHVPYLASKPGWREAL